MKTRERWRRGLRLTKAENMEVCHAVRKAEAARDHRLEKRLRAILLAGQETLTQSSVGKIMGVNPNTITRWVMLYQQGGVAALRIRKAPGAKPRLTEKQRTQLRRLILKGPESCGYDTGVWDAPLVRHLIEERFHVSYSAPHVRTILHKLQLSLKLPKHPPSEGSAKRRREWVRRELPAIKEQAASEHGVVAVEDEVGFKQSGTLQKSWGPVGEDFEVMSKPGRASCRAFGLTTLEANPRFHFRFEPGKFNGKTFTHFLEHVTGQYSKRGQKLHVILDGAPCHTAAKNWAAARPADIQLHFLPPYSPQLNPQEQVWRVTKRKATHDRYFPSVKALQQTVKRCFNRYQGNPAALRNVIKPFV